MDGEHESRSADVCATSFEAEAGFYQGSPPDVWLRAFAAAEPSFDRNRELPNALAAFGDAAILTMCDVMACDYEPWQLEVFQLVLRQHAACSRDAELAIWRLCERDDRILAACAEDIGRFASHHPEIVRQMHEMAIAGPSLWRRACALNAIQCAAPCEESFEFDRRLVDLIVASPGEGADENRCRTELEELVFLRGFDNAEFPLDQGLRLYDMVRHNHDRWVAVNCRTIVVRALMQNGMIGKRPSLASIEILPTPLIEILCGLE